MKLFSCSRVIKSKYNIDYLEYRNSKIENKSFETLNLEVILK